MLITLIKATVIFLTVHLIQAPVPVKIALCTYSRDKKPIEAYVRIYSLPDSTLIKSDYTKGRCEVYLPKGEYYVVYKRCGLTTISVKADKNKQTVTFLDDDCGK